MVAGSRADGFTGDRMQKVGCWTVTSDVEGRPVPVRRTLLRIHVFWLQKSALWFQSRKVFAATAERINCLPAGTAPKQSNQRRASSLSSTIDGPMAQMHP